MTVHQFPAKRGNNGAKPPMELTERVVKIESKLDSMMNHVLPTLATKDEMHKEFNLQTWRIIGAILATAGILLAAIKIIG